LFFEGTEKKFELAVDRSQPSLRSLGDEFWSSVARAAGAEVISKMTGPCGDAYLLSESSLFVFEHKLIMITCGRTQLPDAVDHILSRISPDQVTFFVYERKNEIFPQGQPTSFFEDVKVLNRRLPGRAFQFGEEDEHHLYLFHLDRPFDGDPQDTTLEVLMHGIDADVWSVFSEGSRGTTAPLRRRLGIETILPGFELADHLFEPAGYSLNAMQDDRYWTIHVTPDPLRSYVSFETNHRCDDGWEALVHRVLEVFRPRSFGLVLFDQSSAREIELPRYRLGAHVARDLECGYSVDFMNFYRPQPGQRKPIEIPVD
jgi:S-adenosylmethionine decarboxylase